MRIKVWEPKKEDPKPPLFVKLEEFPEGVRVVTTDRDGKPMWYLLTITESGLRRSACVGADTGLPLDGSLRVRLDE